tara:strand:+ start:421 stop:675 length:255 start_codon:yes stop_codon:yes gene_type:complete
MADSKEKDMTEAERKRMLELEAHKKKQRELEDNLHFTRVAEMYREGKKRYGELDRADPFVISRQMREDAAAKAFEGKGPSFKED